MYILDVASTPLFLLLILPAVVASLSSEDSLYLAMLSCTLPCSNHAAVEDLEPIDHVPKLKLRGHPGYSSDHALQVIHVAINSPLASQQFFEEKIDCSQSMGGVEA